MLSIPLFPNYRPYLTRKGINWVNCVGACARENFDPSKLLMRESDSYLRTPEFSPEDIQHIHEQTKKKLRQQNKMGSEETCEPLRKYAKN